MSACCTRSRSSFMLVRCLTSRDKNVRKRAAGLARHDEVDVQRRKNPRIIAQGLRKAAPFDERLVQRGGQPLERRVA